MSLVNDMLRDLDQRRKESEGPAARIKLTPAGDYPRQEHRNWVPMIVLGLVVVAAGLGYTWMNMNQGSTSQSLDVPVAVVNPVSSTPQEIVSQESAPATAVAAPVVTNTQSPAPETMPQAVGAATPTAAQPTEAQQVANESLTAAAVPAVNPELEMPAPVASLSPPLTRTPIPTPSEQLQASSTVSRNASTRITAGAVAPSVRAPTGTIVAPEQIKDPAEPTPEQKDTLVVQEALRLIANNQPTAAYAALEKHLLDNPYAHQSRETYAKFLMNQGDARSANALVESGLGLAPNHSGFKKVKARLLIAEGNIQAAVGLLESRAPQVANDLEYHEILASAQLAGRDFNGAALSYRSLVQQDQTQGKWWYGFAAAQDALGNTTAARQAYSRALEKPNLSTNLRRRSQDRLNALGQ